MVERAVGSYVLQIGVVRDGVVGAFGRGGGETLKWASLSGDWGVGGFGSNDDEGERCCVTAGCK